ncbi:MAG TPA: hypothetical protein PKH10_04310 [bacterium]|nr:hypothetical protein [bacterium]
MATDARNIGKTIGKISVAISACAFLLGAGFAYWAGMTGDAKSAGCGDPVSAIAIERYVLISSIISTATGALSYFLLAKQKIILRLFLTFVLGVVGFALLFFIFLNFEDWGILYCYRHQ